MGATCLNNQLLLTIIFFVGSSVINGKLITYLDHLNGTMDENFGTVTTKLRYAGDDHYKYWASVDINLLKNLRALSVIFRFVQKPISKRQEKEIFINRKVDVCKVLKGHSLTDLFVVMALQIVRKYGHIPSGCPVKPVSNNYLNDSESIQCIFCFRATTMFMI